MLKRKKKYKLTAGLIRQDLVLIGIGFSSVNSRWMISVLNLYVGLDVKRKIRR